MACNYLLLSCADKEKKKKMPCLKNVNPGIRQEGRCMSQCRLGISFQTLSLEPCD